MHCKLCECPSGEELYILGQPSPILSSMEDSERMCYVKDWLLLIYNFLILYR